jgi:CheY-like chemotaxis protein/signal transduction histidine kinase/CHASE3 domain sensor protein
VPRAVSITRPLIVAVIAPVGLLIIFGIALLMQITSITERQRWVEHTQEAITRTVQIRMMIAEQESALRGYLISRDPVTFQPFDAHDPRSAITALREFVIDNPHQVERADKLRAHYDAWREAADEVIAGQVEPGKVPERMRVRSNLMRSLREVLDEFRRFEETLSQQREAAAREANNTSKLVLGALILAIAAVLAFVTRGQFAGVVRRFRDVLDQESEARTASEQQRWLVRSQLDIGEAIRGELTPGLVAERGLAALAESTGATVGAWFSRETGSYVRLAGFGLSAGAEGAKFADGEGIVGRAANTDAVVKIHQAAPSYLRIASGTGAAAPVDVVAVRLEADGEILGVVELGFVGAAPTRSEELLLGARDALSMAFRSALYKGRLRELLEETQRQGEELQTQQEELRVSNEELEEHATSLREAHARLEEQNSILEERAVELNRASQYKSEFLANMSHELRTPLNSTLILARLLADNQPGNLSPEQVQYAETIHSAGNDLLNMINDILDLAKIEAGRLETRPSPASVGALVKALDRMFRPIAAQKGLELELAVGPDVPEIVTVDRDRVEQILRNLLANALKFTDRGKVSLAVRMVSGMLELDVIDTGIGISKEQQELIFEPFHQGEGGINRRYGGTGLGLSISRQLAHLLGGSLSVESKLREGSRFRLRLPVDGVATPLEAHPPPERVPTPSPQRALVPGESRSLLVVEDDAAFARIVCQTGTELGFRCLTSASAEEGFTLAVNEQPQAIVLDLGLPDHSGLTLLARLKRTSSTRHIPVHVFSASDAGQTARELGAIGFLRKPIAREQLIQALGHLGDLGGGRTRHVLIVEDDPVQQAAITRLLEGEGVETEIAATGKEALARLATQTFDCVVLDLTLPDASGFELIEQMALREGSFPPVIVHTARALTEPEELRLRRHSSSIIIKGARSPERLLDEVTLFLHQVESRLPPERQRMLRDARSREEALEGRRVLVVEDDVRNVFALSRILEGSGAVVEIARNGREAVERVAAAPPIDLVLMDVMMPEMDGLEATRRIRQLPGQQKLPILVLTAKAMPDDHAKCMDAGASDYVAKPIDVQKLMSMIRVWMPR